ncbi:uncharacterized protein BCR38DRAFT_169997 [Pseudomassariella vexata]|uniref:Uncharacterized protein n=1 Tax=Pseudomassariella vexata TaxID=1141098 RepID=A0A1Y2E3D1_9PEZI|nr:uncharacterized protein BCR38DRAFT_169997 [Pseudomassariella vexata]ORY65947.1 hypothetical protein BCR38DRAFT_169997 [Pseudomassariella vexata]
MTPTGLQAVLEPTLRHSLALHVSHGRLRLARASRIAEEAIAEWACHQLKAALPAAQWHPIVPDRTSWQSHHLSVARMSRPPVSTKQSSLLADLVRGAIASQVHANCDSPLELPFFISPAAILHLFCGNPLLQYSRWLQPSFSQTGERPKKQSTLIRV